jgi:CheY-like chemotaxis protein
LRKHRAAPDLAHGPTVLIVDDDPEFRRALGELLADRGYRVAGEAGSVEEGVALVSALAPGALPAA